MEISFITTRSSRSYTCLLQWCWDAKSNIGRWMLRLVDLLYLHLMKSTHRWVHARVSKLNVISELHGSRDQYYACVIKARLQGWGLSKGSLSIWSYGRKQSGSTAKEVWLLRSFAQLRRWLGTTPGWLEQCSLMWKLLGASRIGVSVDLMED